MTDVVAERISKCWKAVVREGHTGGAYSSHQPNYSAPTNSVLDTLRNENPFLASNLLDISDVMIYHSKRQLLL